MTGRTLEEIELGYSEVLDFHPDERKFKESVFPHLLAIAQGQREEMERLHKYIGYLHDSIPELTDEMIDNACGPAMQPIQGIEAVAYGMRMARRSGYRDGWSNCVYRFKQVKEIESPLIGTKK